MQEYNICYSLDFKYLEQLCASIASVLANSQNDENINLFILNNGLSEEDKFKIELLKNVKNFNIKYIEMKNEDFSNCPLLSETNADYSDYHVTLPTYYRFLLPDILPDINRVLYLDCDVIVKSSLRDLFEENIEDYAAAMVLDAESEKEAKRLGVTKYFNAGVMFINLDYWRKNDIKAKLFDYIQNNKDKILWQDQDIINAVLPQNIKEISNKWNYQYFQYETPDNQNGANASILHLAGRFKPWLMPFESEIYDEYYNCLKLTPFKNKIMLYRLNASGKRLKNNKGGSVTNIVVTATDKDLEKCFNEINKSYEYTNEKLSLISENINKDTDLKFSEIYYYTNSHIANLYKEVKSSHTELEHNLNHKIEEISAKNDEIKNQSENLKNEISLLPKTDDIKTLNDNLKQIINEKDFNISVEIKNLKSDFEEKLNLQRIKYEKKLINMENTIQELNSTVNELLKELKKSPFEKFKESFGKKK